jgi:hypothetical protein
MSQPPPSGSLGVVSDPPESSLDSSRHSRQLYGGTLVWLVASFALGWLPLLWINNWTPPSLWSTVLLIALFAVLGTTTIVWWFLVGWCFALAARMRRNAIVLGSLVGAVGIVAESVVQLSGPYGAMGSDDPGIGYLLIAPLIPGFVAVPLLLITGTGFYIHAFRESRTQSAAVPPSRASAPRNREPKERRLWRDPGI